MKNFNPIVMAADIQQDIVEVREATLLLLEFDTDPDTVIANLLNGSNKDLFLDIAQGLRNEYTRDKAIVLGRAALKNIAESIVTDIKEDTDELLTEYLNNIKNVIDVNITALKSIDLSAVSKKLEIATTDPVRLEYLNSKIDTVINPKLASDNLAAQKNLETFLTVALNKLNSIDGDYIVSTTYDKFKKSSDLLLSVFKKEISKDEIINDISVEEVINTIVLADQYEILLDVVNNSEFVPEADNTKLFIQVVESFLKKMASIDNLRTKLYNEISKVSFIAAYEFAKIYYDQTVIKYTDGTINGEVLLNKDSRTTEFEAKLNLALNLINNAIVVDMNKLNNDLAIMDQLADIIVEVLYITVPK